jgi:GTP-binding protein
VGVIKTRDDIRNIAIIAHVDHGKTTLVDGMLKQSKVFRNSDTAGERILDSNDIERERGITILAKNTAVTWGGMKINIVDTPGHADFGGEVERVLNMVDGALLLIDAVEGPMPQTRFVLRKALEMGLRVIVVINKVDRPNARPEEALNKTFDLFIELGATEEQADFPVVYAIGLTGRAGYTPESLTDDLTPMFETIIAKIPAPNVDFDAPAKLLVTTLEYDEYKGQVGVGRIRSGTITKGMTVLRISAAGERTTGKIAYLFTYHNLAKQEVESAQAGDICAFTGFDVVGISDTITDPSDPTQLPPIRVEEPTVRMTFGVNTSPFAGREGKIGWGTSRRIRERLYSELTHNVALRVADTDQADQFVVSGRGELHLGILIETMRREGFEFQVSRPEVIYRQDPETGEMLEPFEEVHIEVADTAVGTVVELLGVRRGLMVDMRSEHSTTYVKYIVPTRGLLGFRQLFLTATSGLGQLNSLFAGYQPFAGQIPGRQFGSLVAHEPGVTTPYGLDNAQLRGSMFIGSQVDVYEGMVVGEHIRPEDLTVNVAKAKHLTNMRRSFAEEGIRLTPPRNLSLDDCIEFLAEDELLEVTPQNLRIRKRVLNNEERQKDQKRREKLLT